MPDATFTALLISTCTVNTMVLGAKDDDTGLPAESTTPEADVICRKEDAPIGASRVGVEIWRDKEIARANAIFFFEYGTAITEYSTISDVVTLGVTDPETWNVLYVSNPGGLNHHLEVYAEAVRAET